MESVPSHEKITVFELRQRHSSIKKKWHTLGRVANQLLYEELPERHDEGLERLNQISDHINVISDLMQETNTGFERYSEEVAQPRLNLSLLDIKTNVAARLSNYNSKRLDDVDPKTSPSWGCTQSTCIESFDNTDDWRNHENTHHLKLETWRCCEPEEKSKINQCATLLYDRDSFQNHLRDNHSIEDENHIHDRFRRNRMGRNGQGRFWCGFCKSIVELQTRGEDAWDERFHHIDDMHVKKGQRFEDWYPPDKDLPLGLLRSEMILNSKVSYPKRVCCCGGQCQRLPSPPPPPPPPSLPLEGLTVHVTKSDSEESDYEMV